MKVGILKETRRWDDRRVAITPETAALIMDNYPNVELFVQQADFRVHRDDEYRVLGIPIVDDVTGCDVLFGVKEVDNEHLIDGKTYVLFAHVAKEQSHNKEFFRLMAKKKITLIDYEYLTDKNGNRLVAFGFWAGVVGAYYAFSGVARRFCNQRLPGPEQCRDLNELHRHLKAIKLPALKIVVTGGGRVASGALEIIAHLGIAEVLPKDFLLKDYSHPVFTRLDPADYVKRKEGEFEYAHFIHFPEAYESAFSPFSKVADVMIACHFWNSASPVFFTRDELKNPDFSISVIADISCDVPGPIPTTIRTSSIESPFYDVDPETLEEKPPFSNAKQITVMAVDNLPAALPMDASRTFARDLYYEVFPSLFGGTKTEIIQRATILKEGKLNNPFGYLASFLDQ